MEGRLEPARRGGCRPIFVRISRRPQNSSYDPAVLVEATPIHIKERRPPKRPILSRRGALRSARFYQGGALSEAPVLSSAVRNPPLLEPFLTAKEEMRICFRVEMSRFFGVISSGENNFNFSNLQSAHRR